MADPVATVEKIVKLGLKIKEATDTVRHNQEECQEVRKRVLRFSAILSQLQQTGMMNNSPAMSGALEDLEESLQHALELLTACQETSTVRHLFTAGDLAKQLRRVKEDISDKVMLASFAINTHTTIVLLTIQAGGHPHLPPRQPEDAVAGISHSSQSTDDAGSDIHYPNYRSELNDVQTNLLAGNEGSIPDAIRKFRWSELKAATNGFSNGNHIDGGGFSNVYKGVLKDGSIVAIKKNYRNMNSQINGDKFILLVSKLQHKNIVKFVGYSHEVSSISVGRLFKRKKDGFIIVEEYVPNGSLYKIIEGSQDFQLDWSSVFRIVDGVAQGIQYLHEQRVLHMDVKPSNILLDSDMNPIITDFSISKVLDHADGIEESCVIGTFGYIPPESMGQCIMSVKNDVFAFGTTLLVTVASMRRCPADDSPWIELNQHRYIGRWAWKAWEAGRIEEEFDPSLFEESQLTQMKRCVEIGLLCTQRDWEYRPTMADVVEMLHGHKELPVPKMPSWFQEDGNSSPL